jgi:hypothetical protein
MSTHGNGKKRTIGDCRREIVEALILRSIVMCGQPANQIDLGNVSLSCSEFVAGIDSEKDAETAEMKRIMGIIAGIHADAFKAAQSACIYPDQVMGAFIIVTCSDGCVGLIIGVPSSPSNDYAECMLKVCTCSGEPVEFTHG